MNYSTQADRFGLYSAHQSEIIEMAKRLRFPIDDILSAVQEVGFDEDEIQEYIRDRQDRAL